MLCLLYAVFTMAEIQSIGHDHQVTFGVVLAFLVVMVFVLRNQAVTTRQKQAVTCPIFLGLNFYHGLCLKGKPWSCGHPLGGEPVSN